MVANKTLGDFKEHDKLNSMLYWYPKIIGRVPTPKTLFVAVDQVKLYRIMEGEGDRQYASQIIKEVQGAVKLVGGPPAFLRTDQCAGKHEWEDTCYIGNLEEVGRHIFRVAEANESAGIMGLRYKALAIREFLKLESTFKAFKGMPVAREFRFFSKHGEILCHHPYWPEEAISFWHGTPEPDGWQQKLRELQSEPEDFEIAQGLAREATTWSDRAWSVDICRTNDKNWFVTDMALAEDSFHWENCSKKVRD